MIEKIGALKLQATKRADYYTAISFPNLAKEYMELVNILNEMETIVKERDELAGRVSVLEETIETMKENARAARDINEEFE